MSDLNIRNVEPGLVKRLKVRAAERGVTLRELVVGMLGDGLGAGTDSARAERPANKRCRHGLLYCMTCNEGGE